MTHAFLFYLLFYVLFVKLTIFNILIYSSSLYNFWFPFQNLLQIVKWSYVLSQIYDTLGFFKFFILFALIAIDFSHTKLFKVYSQKVFTYYWIVCLRSVNTGFNIFVSCEFLYHFYWNMFRSKAVKICDIITNHMQSYPMSS